MMQVVGAIALFLQSTVLSAAAPATEKLPRLPIVLKDGSIGECSGYGTWWTSERTIVYRNERDRSSVAFVLKPHERFKGLTGNIHTLAWGWFVVPKGKTVEVQGNDFRQTLQPGEKLWLTRYDSEGEWDGWYRGRTIFVNLGEWTVLGDTTIHRPKTEWWAKVRNQGGQIGWIVMYEAPHIYGVDNCGGLPDWAERDRRRFKPGDYWYTGPHAG